MRPDAEMSRRIYVATPPSLLIPSLSRDALNQYPTQVEGIAFPEVAKDHSTHGNPHIPPARPNSTTAISPYPKEDFGLRNFAESRTKKHISKIS
ncbi:uncharacterized protein CLUP02_05968 [Colletotrichum lupini]|uniref:Uncharacterized protein n=1 Tax=Colletotrichum lupini TaxID=145971 RepID=A0A9Q8SP46_9PEZI|nr:uncharacterized protein CLUP02_05968 [Colletotrichum lupini]UQC80485.1 hypothetical protein CLUP02_05968 [Colletotrichum lupini]